MFWNKIMRTAKFIDVTFSFEVGYIYRVELETSRL